MPLNGQQFDFSEPQAASRKLTTFLDELPSGWIQGCLWALDEDAVFVNFVIDDAKKIASHLVEWSEYVPEEWFQVEIAETDDGYALALMPSIEKSIERVRIQAQLRYGYPLPTNKTHVVLRPLHFGTSTKTAFSMAKPKIQKFGKIGVSLVDSSSPILKMKPEMLQESDLSSQYKIGTFDVKFETDPDSYTSRLLSQAG